jgi:hypothetical protein
MKHGGSYYKHLRHVTKEGENDIIHMIPEAVLQENGISQTALNTLISEFKLVTGKAIPLLAEIVITVSLPSLSGKQDLSSSRKLLLEPHNR